MAINWNNFSPKTPNFLNGAPRNPASAYMHVPNFIQTTGVLPGQAPVTGHTVAPTPVNLRAALAKLPSFFKLSH